MPFFPGRLDDVGEKAPLLDRSVLEREDDDFEKGETATVVIRLPEGDRSRLSVACDHLGAFLELVLLSAASRDQLLFVEPAKIQVGEVGFDRDPAVESPLGDDVESGFVFDNAEILNRFGLRTAGKEGEENQREKR